MESQLPLGYRIALARLGNGDEIRKAGEDGCKWSPVGASGGRAGNA